MSLEQLINELARIHAMHPNAEVIIKQELVGGVDESEPTKIVYDNLSRSAVIEL